MTTTQKWKLLSGAIWNLRQWIEARQHARKIRDAIAEHNASIRVNVWRATCQRIRALPIANCQLPIGNEQEAA